MLMARRLGIGLLHRVAGVAALLLLIASVRPALATELSVRLAGLDVTVWEPAPDTASPRPVLLFSHGFHGCATQSRFIRRAPR